MWYYDNFSWKFSYEEVTIIYFVKQHGNTLFNTQNIVEIANNWILTLSCFKMWFCLMGKHEKYIKWKGVCKILCIQKLKIREFDELLNRQIKSF
jgi:hypothetical protein